MLGHDGLLGVFSLTPPLRGSSYGWGIVDERGTKHILTGKSGK